MKNLKFRNKMILARVLPAVFGLLAMVANIAVLRVFGESALLVDVRMVLSLMVASASAYYIYLMASKCITPAISFDDNSNFAMVHAAIILGSFLMTALLWLGIYFAV